MRHYKKIIAAIAATVLTVSTTATGVTAFADELEKDAYLAGIEDVET
jgi:peptidoglycan hydrolase CwlO-like protein